MALPNPPLLVITDRSQARRGVIEIAAASFAAGGRWFSLREKDLPAAERRALLGELVALGRNCDALVMAHDDIDAVVATGKPVVLLLMNGRPLDLRGASKVPAILDVWYPGTQGGAAVANLLFGTAVPGGKLPFSWVRDVGQVPRFLRLANGRPFFFLATRFLTNETAIGRKLARLMRAGRGSPLVRIRSKEIRAAGIRRVGRVTGSRGGQPVLEDGRVLDVATVLWCNGFRLDFSWINLPIFDADGYPRHERGRVPSYPGLYFAGLPFQRNLASSTLVGANRDSAVVVGWIVERVGLSTTVRRQTMAPVRA